MSDPDREPTPEGHWYPTNVENQPPRDELLSLRRLVQETRGRLGPGAGPDRVHEDLVSRGLAISTEEVRRVWEELA